MRTRELKKEYEDRLTMQFSLLEQIDALKRQLNGMIDDYHSNANQVKMIESLIIERVKEAKRFKRHFKRKAA